VANKKELEIYIKFYEGEYSFKLKVIKMDEFGWEINITN
jgi:hypothetical protein